MGFSAGKGEPPQRFQPTREKDLGVQARSCSFVVLGRIRIFSNPCAEAVGVRCAQPNLRMDGQGQMIVRPRPGCWGSLRSPQPTGGCAAANARASRWGCWGLLRAAQPTDGGTGRTKLFRWPSESRPGEQFRHPRPEAREASQEARVAKRRSSMTPCRSGSRILAPSRSVT